MDLGQLNPAMLAEHVGSRFEVLDDPENVFSVTLAEVVEHSKTEHNQAFSLFFHGPLDRFMPQGIHKLTHPHAGRTRDFSRPYRQGQRRLPI